MLDSEVQKGKMGVKQAIKSLDAFPRAEDHLLQKTQSGALGDELSFFFLILFKRLLIAKVTWSFFSSLLFLVSVVGLVIMAILFLHELRYYITTYTVHQVRILFILLPLPLSLVLFISFHQILKWLAFRPINLLCQQRNEQLSWSMVRVSYWNARVEK